MLPADLLGDIMHLQFFLQAAAMWEIGRGEDGRMAILLPSTQDQLSDALPRRADQEDKCPLVYCLASPLSSLAP